MKTIVRIILVLITLALFVVLAGALAFRIANRTNGTILSGGVERAYLLYVPESYDPSAPTPLIITIHGYAQWPAHQMQLTRWNDLADEYGFLVVYPAGTQFPMRWRTSGAPGTETDPAIDVAFISGLIDKLEQEYNIDPNRIYANGLSNGGGMSFVLSCQHSDRIAAVGLVAGAYLTPWEACSPTRPVPAIIFHGTEDPIVPFQGGPSRSFDLPFPVIDDWVDTLASRYGCTGALETIPASGSASGVRFTDCAADLVYYTIEGGGHTWPGGEPLPERIAGTTTADIDATGLMWEFFQQHPLE